jgi:hypothetical protein
MTITEKTAASQSQPFLIWGQIHNVLKWMHFTAFVTFGFQALLTAFPSSAARKVSLHLCCGYSVSMSTLVSTNFIVVSLHHLMLLNESVFAMYVEGLAQNQNMFRWCEYAVSAMVMVAIIGFLVGVEDVLFLTMLFVNMSMMVFSGVWAELDQNKRWFPHFCGWSLFAHLWLQIFVQLEKLEAQVTNGAPSFDSTFEVSKRLKVLRILVPNMFFFFCLFGILQTLNMLRFGPWKHYLSVEISYTLLSLTTKTAMGFILLSTSSSSQ